MTKVDDALISVSKLGFDTTPIIYFVEANPKYDALVTEIFSRVNAGTIIGYTSVITLSEILVQPIRHSDYKLRSEYRNLLLNSVNFYTKHINSNIAEETAVIRAKYNLRTPDALQIAVALDAGCEAFLCNDMDLRRVTELNVLVLEELTL